MYKIIGGDGKHYGPISIEQVRAWIQQGRANAQTLAQAEGSADWRPLSTFPEFADVLGIAPAAPVPGMPGAGSVSGTREAALQAVRGPSTGLKVTAILGFVAVAISLVVNVLAMAGVRFEQHSMNNPEFERLFSATTGALGIIEGLIKAAVGVLILIGAGKLGRLESQSFAMAACILAMVPCVSPCCLLGLPFGIWALIVMNRPEVKSQFI